VKPDSGRILVDDRFSSMLRLWSNLRPPGPALRLCIFKTTPFPAHDPARESAFAAERRPRLDRHRFVAEMLERFRLSEFAARYRMKFPAAKNSAAPSRRALVGNPKLLFAR